MPDNYFPPNQGLPQQGSQGKLILRGGGQQPVKPGSLPSYNYPPPQQRGLQPPSQGKTPQYPQPGPPLNAQPPQQPQYVAAPPQQMQWGGGYPPPGSFPYQQYGGQPGGPRPPQKRRRPWLRTLIIVLVVLAIACGTAFAYYQVTFGNSLSTITGQSAIHAHSDTTAPADVNVLTQRTNIVLLGSDTDGKGNDPNQGTPLAQTVIILTINPQTHYVGMLSIPRDMQVSDTTQGYANEKLDEVFEHAWVGQNANERARAAAGHMMDVIQQNYGIHIDHYAWVGLQGFIKVIDTVGGVDVDVTHVVEDDLYPDDTNNAGGSAYDYMRLYIAPGPQHLDGQEALEYVRTRHADLGGDFGRTDRQQQVLSVLKEKLSSTDSLSKAPELLKDLNGFLMTDLSLSDLASLAQLAKGIDTRAVQHVSLTPPTYAVSGLPRNNYGPACDQVEKVIQQMFNTQPQCIPQTANTPSSGFATTGTSHNTIAQTTASRPFAATSAGPADVHNLLDLMLLTTFGSFDAVHNE